MMHTREDSTAANVTSAFEWWYIAHFAFGAVHAGFVAILIPTYVLSMTGRASDVGLAIFVYGLGAMLVPIVGGLADRYRAYRIAQLAGLACYVLGSLAFVFSGDRLLLTAAAGVLGLGSSILQMIDPAFILGAGFQREAQSRRLTRLSQTERVGQVLGGLVVAGLVQWRLSFPACFAIMAGLSAGCLLLTALNNRQAAARIERTGPGPAEAPRAAKSSLADVLTPAFVLFLLAAMFARAGLDMFYGQYPNYMRHVFQIGPALSAMAVSVCALLTLVVLDVVGRWMARSGPRPVWLASLSAPIAAAVALIVLGSLAPVPAVLPLGMYVVLRLCVSWANLSQPPLAHGLSGAALGTTQGILWGCLVLGFTIANMAGGWLADALGFESIPWAMAGLSVLGLFLGCLAVQHARAENPLVSHRFGPGQPSCTKVSIGHPG